ncbi:MAG: hypothetical protein ACTSQ8_23390 [Candidatus Helarchaeota archaeon]
MLIKKKTSKRITKRPRNVNVLNYQKRNDLMFVSALERSEQSLPKEEIQDTEGRVEKRSFSFQGIDSWLPMLIELLIYLVVFLSLRETINFLYADDDLVTSMFKGIYFFDGVTVKNFFQFLRAILEQQMSMGRITIGSFPTFIPMLFFNVMQYRIYVLILICVNIWLFGKCVYQWTGSYKIKWFSMILSPLFFQIHYNFHHPILSYYGGMQLLFIILFSSMYFFWKYCTEHKKRWLVISCLFYLWGLVTYEVAFVFILVFILLAFFATKNIKKAILRPIPHFVIFGGLITFSLLNKTAVAQNSYSGSTINFDLFLTALATIKQMVATIPLSNFMVNNWGQYGTIIPKSFLISSITLGDTLSVILFLIVVFLIFKTTEEKFRIDLKNTGLFSVLGLLIVLLPSGLMGLSARYQNEIRWGAGHIPVYIQYFGLIILLVAVYILVREGIKKFDTKKIVIGSINILMVVLSVFILLANQQYGRAQMNNYDNAMYNNVLALQYSLEDGVIGDISEDVLIINSQVVPTYLSSSEYSSYFFGTYSKKRLESVVYIDDFSDRLIDDYKAQGKLFGTIDYTPTKSTYIVRTNRETINGVIYIGRVQNMTIDLDNRKIARYEIDELRIYAMNAVSSKFVSLYEKIDGLSYVHTFYLIEPNLKNNGTRGSTYKFVFNHSVVDFYSTCLVYDIDNIEPEFYNVEIQPQRIDLDAPVVVGNNQNTSGFLTNGWSGLEAWGIWSEGDWAELNMKLNEVPDSDLLVTFEVNIFAPKGNLNFSILVNGVSVDDFSLPSGRQIFSVTVPKDNIIEANGEIRIVFDIKNPEAPADAGVSDDPRKLGIGLVSFVIETEK